MAFHQQPSSPTVVEAVAGPNPRRGGSSLERIRSIVAFVILLAGQCLPSSATNVWPILVDKLDLDGDGTVDFELRRGFSYGPGQPPDPHACFRPFGAEGHGLHSLQNNRVLLGTRIDCFGPIESLAPGTLIGPSFLPHQGWGLNGDTFNIIFSPSGIHETNGPLATATSALVGVQFTSPQGIHFGWVEVASPGPGEPPRIVGYAAEGAPSTPIPAGATPSTPFPKPLIPLIVPPSDSLIGGILIENSTNTSTGQITRRVEVRVIPEIECLIEPVDPEWPPGSYPVPLVERTFLPNPLPSGWIWKKPGENLHLYSSTEAVDGTLIEQSGPLTEAESILIGLRKAGGETWWIEFQRNGIVSFASHSPANSAQLLVGHPSIPVPPTQVKYIDINRDGFIDFIESTTTPAPGDEQHTLHPLRGQKILTPSNVHRFGTQISMEPPSDSTWSTNSLTLLHTGTSTGPFGNNFAFYRSVGVPDGTNGYIAIQFSAGSNSHVGWIRYNRYAIFLGVMGVITLVDPELDYFDHGYQRTAGTPVTIGADSTLPFTVRIQQDGNQLRLQWDPLLQYSARLETSSSIHSPEWAPMGTSGADTFLYPLPTTPSPLFFRLQATTPKPPLVMP